MENSSDTMFFDPFAETGQQLFDPLEAFARTEARYLDEEVEHDYTADKFVSDAEVLIMDAQFNGMFAVAALIENRMHQLCAGCDGHGDSRLSSSMEQSGVFGQRDRQRKYPQAGVRYTARPRISETSASSKKRRQEQRRRKQWPGLAAKLIELAWKKAGN